MGLKHVITRTCAQGQFVPRLTELSLHHLWLLWAHRDYLVLEKIGAALRNVFMLLTHARSFSPAVCVRVILLLISLSSVLKSRCCFSFVAVR